MHTIRLRGLWAGAIALLLVLATSVFGQGVTSSSINGYITDAQGNPLGGITVVAVHVPSGTKASSVSRSTGEYDINGLRPGGPYTVTASGPGFPEQSQSNINLSVGESHDVPFNAGEVQTLASVNVTSTRFADTTFTDESFGSGITMNEQQVRDVPTVRRDIQDLQNMDPRVVVMQVGPADSQYTLSVAGQNPRENAFLIDGVSAADNFGLNSNGYAAFRNPVPPEWVGSLDMEVDPFDITYSGFLGVLTNITIKSGTNEVHGGFYDEYEGTKFRGPDPVANAYGSHEPMQAHTVGGYVGGPIIKDKLFYFVGYDTFREISVSPAQQFVPDDSLAGALSISGTGAGGGLTNTSEGVIDQIVQKAESFGYNPGSLAGPAHVWNQNFVGKINWNISDSQKFEFTFRHTAGEAPNFYNYSSSFETSFTNSWYDTYRTDQSYTAKLQSDWSALIPNLSTDIGATYKRYNGTAKLQGSDFPAVTIYNVPGSSTTGGTPPFELFLGTYSAYQLNNIYTWEQDEHAYGEYSFGNHTLKFGSEFDRTGYTDTFISNYLGSYSFSSVQDFLNATPTGVGLATAAPGYTLGEDVSHYYLLDIEPVLQDTWKVTPDLTLVGGLRLDYPYEPQNPPPSAIFQNAYGYTNSTTMNGQYSISPRLAFHYNFPTDNGLHTQIYGGAGLFLGQNPVVWVENSFNNAGQTTTYSKSNNSTIITNGSPNTYFFNGSSTPTPPLNAAVPVPTFDITDPNFHWPSSWKESLSIDRDLPWLGMIASAKVDLSQVKQDLLYQNLNLKAPAGVMPDGALKYWGAVTPGSVSAANTISGAPSYVQQAGSSAVSYYASVSSGSVDYANTTTGPVYQLTNTRLGGSQMYTLELKRPVKDGWGFSFGYTHTHSTVVDDDPSSVASTNFSDNYYVNPNDNVAYKSQYAAPDKFVVSGTKEFRFVPGKDYVTSVTLVFLAETGQSYSDVFKGDGDGSTGSNQSLFYVPNGPSDPKVAWLSPTEESNFFQWLANDPDVAKYEGQIVPRNALHAGEEHYLNVHLEQRLPVYRDLKVTLFTDCFDFANMLNHKWGQVADYDNSFESRTIAGTGYNPAGNGGAGQYVYTFNSSTLGLPTTYSDMSRWSLQVGAKVEF